MPYTVKIRNNETGEIRSCEQDEEWDGEVHEFMWTEGNYSCDCNRSLFFYRAGRESEDSMARPCGDTRFDAVCAILADGTTIPLDDPSN